MIYNHNTKKSKINNECKKAHLVNIAWNLYQTQTEYCTIIRNLFEEEFDAIEEALESTKEEPFPF